MSEPYDVIIIGAGGAGLTAALYAARANLRTLVFERGPMGGQIALTDTVENYPGFPDGVTGPGVSELMAKQATKFGAQIRTVGVTGVRGPNKLLYDVATDSGSFQAPAIILASGANPRMLQVPGERELTGKGVSYCATCDGPFFKGKEIVVVGGGDSAMQEGLFLTTFATQVHVVHRREKLRASAILQDRARSNRKMDFIWNTVVTAVAGKDRVEAVRLKNVQTQEEREFRAGGLFVFVGHDPATAFLQGFVELDEKGYVVAPADTLQTSKPGVFAAGEVRQHAVKQLVSACGEGCEAALAAQHYLENLPRP